MTDNTISMNPKELGYYFPAEWEKHEATWLTWPYLDDSFPGILNNIYTPYIQFIKHISLGEKVRINVPDESELNKLITLLLREGIDKSMVETFIHPSNDVWCRDHGPAFVVNHQAIEKKAIVNWEFNAWGNKYPCDLDNLIPEKIAEFYNLPLFSPGIVMEGGSIETNGNGTILSTTSCLLNKNRNPKLNLNELENYLFDFYGVQQVLWLKNGIAGDDTDGHIDDITRFINSDSVITVIETDELDENFEILQDNLQILKTFRLLNNKQLNIIELPMPKPLYFKGNRLPASYANFYITNKSVIVPLFDCLQDEVALEIIASVFPGRQVTGINSKDIICGLGSFHCLSQQEPMV